MLNCSPHLGQVSTLIKTVFPPFILQGAFLGGEGEGEEEDDAADK